MQLARQDTNSQLRCCEVIVRTCIYGKLVMQLAELPKHGKTYLQQTAYVKGYKNNEM